MGVLADNLINLGKALAAKTAPRPLTTAALCSAKKAARAKKL